MAESAKKTATYEDLYKIPENMIGEIIDGELVASPRPSPEHSNAASSLGGEIVPPYRFGRGGPGGWIILFEPEIRFSQTDLLVPDFAGWRKERFPGWPKENWFSVAPDWICEILSPATVRNDRIVKMAAYARYEVQHFWLIDPRDKTLEVFRLLSGQWVKLGGFAENDRVRAEPFQEVEIKLELLWTAESSGSFTSTPS
ncbi:MAG: Uma2 family endonuclease [Desulfobacteraceae bacterium]|jgi:Uma2 family endonuclease|nr:Uma2 family endonuclease [Desulfobacteraceae bacterium]